MEVFSMDKREKESLAEGRAGSIQVNVWDAGGLSSGQVWMGVM